MKVLQINAVYGRGSTGTIVRDIEQLCEQKGIECYIVSPDPNVKTARRGYIIGNAIDHKIHALLCRLNGKQAYFSTFATKRLLRYLDQIRPDVVHLHNLHSNYINLNLLLQYLTKHDVRTIITLHDCWFYTGGCFHYTAVNCNRWLKNCGNCPKKRKDTPAFFIDKSEKILRDRIHYFSAIPRLEVTGVSRWIADEARRTFLHNRPIHVIYNGVNTDIFIPTKSKIREKLGICHKRVYLGPAGKWFLESNLQALKYFADNMQENEVLILFGTMQSPIKLPTNVILYPYIKKKNELAALYSCADVFINPTREESLSLINIEAQSCGTPVVTYGGTGVQETVDDYCGFSVSSGNYEQLYEIAHHVEKNSLNLLCRQWVEKRYDICRNYEQYIKLYSGQVL